MTFTIKTIINDSFPNGFGLCKHPFELKWSKQIDVGILADSILTM